MLAWARRATDDDRAPVYELFLRRRAYGRPRDATLRASCPTSPRWWACRSRPDAGAWTAPLSDEPEGPVRSTTTHEFAVWRPGDAGHVVLTHRLVAEGAP